MGCGETTIYYCDGSQDKTVNKMGIGIVGLNFIRYHEISDFNWEDQLHEVEAIIKVIELASLNDCQKFSIVNDDRHLIRVINLLSAGKKVRSKILIGKPRFNYMMNLIKMHKVSIEPPQTIDDKKKIKMCHNLSRTYLKIE